MLQAIDIPAHLFGPVTDSGTRIGMLLARVAEETGTGGVGIVVPACHDTDSTVVAVPAQNQDFAWISSGMWSISGRDKSSPPTVAA